MGCVMTKRRGGSASRWMAAWAMALSMSGCAGNDRITGAIEGVAMVSTIPLMIFCGGSSSNGSAAGQFSQGGSNYEFLPSHRGGR